jgi:hypothetical protein
VGTPYENIWSTIGVPPNNKVVQCVPRDLVPIQNDSEQKEEDIERRMHKVMTVLSDNAKAIYKLSKWREAAPCDAIPGIAFEENVDMCRTMNFRDDKMATRCMDHRAATKLSQDATVIARAKEAEDDSDKRTCFANDKELVRKINEHTHRVKLWRQKLRNAVEDAMRVPDFVRLFDVLGQSLQTTYAHPDSGAPRSMDDNHPSPSITWSDVNSYMTHDVGSAQDLLEQKPCKEAEKEAAHMKELLSGGGDECGEDGCNARLLRVLKIMHKTLHEERELKIAFGAWKGANFAKIAALQKDESCDGHAKTDNYCELMKEECSSEFGKCEPILPKDMDAQCFRTPGGKYVHLENHGVTWDVERYTDDGEPVGFRWLAEPEVRDIFDSYKQQALQGCAFRRNQLWSSTTELQAEHRSRTKTLMKLLTKHYSTAASNIHMASYKQAVETNNEDTALRNAAKEIDIVRIAEAVVDRMMKKRHERADGTVVSLGDVVSKSLVTAAGKTPTFRQEFTAVPLTGRSAALQAYQNHHLTTFLHDAKKANTLRGELDEGEFDEDEDYDDM